ncbi:ribonuclease kappa [Drosophila rhopaloa]|uniref:Ribonuclease kappa n=1 Tax=Drosophila rhopaloa TaxID=1041015 RepID=A0A6P4FLC9_DRORH|nr:ribonuclease kappa [Drosophila rhopaloa]
MVCGRKCSFFCLFMSSWAFLMLNILGICFYLRSLVLLMDLPLPLIFHDPEDFKAKAEEAYQTVAIRCFVTAIVFLGFVFISIIAIRQDNKKRKRLYKRAHRR